MASASSMVRVEVPVKIRAPLCVAAPGKIMMKFDPRELMVSWMDYDAPLPMATTTITHPTPMTMPSMVRNERSLFRKMALRPTMVMLPRRLREFLMAYDLVRYLVAGSRGLGVSRSQPPRDL